MRGVRTTLITLDAGDFDKTSLRHSSTFVHVSGRLSSIESEVGEFVIGELKGVTPGHSETPARGRNVGTASLRRRHQ